MTKTEAIQSYLTNNSNEKLNALLRHNLTQTAIAQQFDVSKPIVRQAILNVEPEFDVKRRQVIIDCLNTLYYYMQRGIPLDILISLGYADVVINNYNEQSVNLIMIKLRQYHVVERIERHSVATSYLLPIILKNVQIEDMINKSYDQHEIVAYLNVTRSHVHKISQNLMFTGRAMPTVSKRLYDSVQNNLKCYIEQSFQTMSQEEQKLVQKTMQKYYEKKDGDL